MFVLLSMVRGINTTKCYVMHLCIQLFLIAKSIALYPLKYYSNRSISFTIELRYPVSSIKFYFPPLNYVRRETYKKVFFTSFSNMSTGKISKLTALQNVIGLKTIQVLADALPQRCLGSKDIMLKLLSLSSKAIVE